MSATAASTLAPVAARLSRLGVTRTTAAIGLSVAFALRLVLVYAHPTPTYFPDEYLYAALGRSLAHFHGPEIRGHAAHFPALLQPLLTAPAWRAGSVETGYRIVQAIGAFTFTLAAIPAYLLARRLHLSRGLSLGVVGVALLVPDGIYASYVIAEPIAYPLVLGAAAAAVVALATSSRRAQILFLVLATAATAARVQFVALPACYVLAVGILGLRERALRKTIREQRLVFAVLGAGAVLLLAGGASHLLGYYDSVLHPHVHPLAALASLARNSLVFTYSSGWILVPGALLGLGFAIARPRSRMEAACGAFVAPLLVVLLLQASLFGETQMIQERYFFYLFPLSAICFCLYATRGWPLGRVHALLAVGLIVISSRITLAGYAQPRSYDHSPFLLGVAWLELKLGSGNGAVVMAAIAGPLALGAALAPLRPRVATRAVLAAGVAVCALSFSAAFAWDHTNSTLTREANVAVNPSWVDATHVGPVTLVTAAHGRATQIEEHLWWNESLTRVDLLPSGLAPDRLTIGNIRMAADGTALVDGRPITGPVLLDGYGATVLPRDGSVVKRWSTFTVWRPRKALQLEAYMPGRYSDGALALRGSISVWPPAHVRGRVELLFGGPDIGKLALTLRHAGRTRTYLVAPGHELRLRFPACTSGPWRASFTAPPQERYLGRVIAGRAATPHFVPDPSACAGK